MPLPPLPPNNTGRVWFQYVTGEVATSQVHEVMLRYPDGGASGDVQEAFLTILNAIGASNFRQGWRVTSARESAAGSVFSLPITLQSAIAAFEGTASSPEYNPRFEAVERVYGGRSISSGRRVDFSLYTALSDADPTFREENSPALQLALLGLWSLGAGAVIDGTRPVFYSYTNFNYNSAWESKLRS